MNIASGSLHISDPSALRHSTTAAKPDASGAASGPSDGFQYSIPFDEPSALSPVQAPPMDTAAVLRASLREQVQGYLGNVTQLSEVVARGKQLPQMAKAIIAVDVGEVLGETGGAVRDNFLLPPGNYEALPQFANTLLQELSKKVLGHVEGGKFQGLDKERLSLQKQQNASAQHTGYLSGKLTRLEGLEKKPNQEACRILLRKFFGGELKSTDGKESGSREFLANELGKLTPDGQVVRDWVMHKDQDRAFVAESTQSPASLLANLAAHDAGEATLEFAAKLVGGDDEKAAALVKSVFSRPEGEIQQMMGAPRGKAGLLLHFAAMAHHQAWEFSKLGTAYVRACAGDEAGVEDWNHKNLGPTRKMVNEDREAARKVGDQIISFMLREGRLVPLERNGQTGDLPLSDLLERVETNGVRTQNREGSSVVSPFAARVGECLHNEVQTAAHLSDWKAGGEFAADLVANVCASFAAQATGADYEKKESLVGLYRDALSRFSPQVDKLLAQGIPDKQDEAYQAFYGDMAGEFSFEALKAHMSVAQARELARNARIHHIIPQVCKLLELEPKEDFTATQVVADLAEMQKNLLKGDYFLEKPGFLDSMKAEAAETPLPVAAEDLENAIRVPNAMWMWTQLMRGLVEHKPTRYTGGPPDRSSDKFPAQVQLYPPDTRDIEIFDWARYRLRENGYQPADASRMAMSLVVFTQHKDLLQIRKSA